MSLPSIGHYSLLVPMAPTLKMIEFSLKTVIYSLQKLKHNKA
jgi:hypothetical protein